MWFIKRNGYRVISYWKCVKKRYIFGRGYKFTNQYFRENEVFYFLVKIFCMRIFKGDVYNKKI